MKKVSWQIAAAIIIVLLVGLIMECFNNHLVVSADNKRTIAPIFIQNATSPTTLSVGTPIEFELNKGNPSKEFQIKLEKGEFIQIDIEQNGIDVSSTISDTNGKVLLDINLQVTGLERFYFIASEPGLYIIKLKFNESVSNIGKAIINLPALKTANAAEQQLIQSQSLILKGYDELAQNNKLSTEKAIEHFNKALSISESHNNIYNIAAISEMLGKCYYTLGDIEKVIPYFIKSLEGYRELGNKQLELVALNNVGVVLIENGKYQDGVKYSEEALVLSGQLGERITEIYIINNLSLANYYLGNISKAIEYSKESLTAAKKINNKEAEALATGNLGTYLEKIGKFQESIKYFSYGASLSHEVGNLRSETLFLNNLARCYHRLNQRQSAIRMLENTLITARKLGDKALISLILTNIAASYVFSVDQLSITERDNKVLAYL